MEIVEQTSWISWFCGLKGNEFFCMVNEDYIEDRFNLTGLHLKVPHYHRALEVILGFEPDDDDDDDDDDELDNDSHWSNDVEQAAEMLYGLIHARYILSMTGMGQMLKKYQDGDFGQCPRVYCESQLLLPIGLSDDPGVAMVKLYCPKCMDVYTPKSSRVRRHIDGAFFGTSFPHALFMVLPTSRPKPPTNKYEPKLYGFKIHPTAYEFQQKAPLALAMNEKC